MPYVASRLVRGDEAEGLRLMLPHMGGCEVVIHFHIFRTHLCDLCVTHVRNQASGRGGGPST